MKGEARKENEKGLKGRMDARSIKRKNKPSRRAGSKNRERMIRR